MANYVGVRKSASKKIKCTVDGYIHEHQACMKKISQFYNIPKLIHHLITCYYTCSDSWNEKQIGKNMWIKKNCIMLTAEKTGHAFLTNVITKDIYVWTFRIKQMHPTLIIGIWDVKNQYPGPGKYYDVETKNFTYCFWATMAIAAKNINNKIYEDKPYAVECTAGDTLKMILNMNELSLSYTINEKKYGKAFKDIKKTSYKAVVYMESYHVNEGCIELLKSDYC